MEQNNATKPFNDDEESNFDIIEWLWHFLHRWYFFVAGIIIALSLAFLQNRSWKAQYQTAGTVLIDESRAGVNSSQALMQGFSIQQGYRNTTNQVIMLGSYDLISRVVDSLPFMRVDYLSKGNFKTRNLYNTSPINIDPTYISPEAYNMLFKIKLHTNGRFEITIENNKIFNNFKIDGRLGQPLQTNLFFITVNNNSDNWTNSELYFQFRTKESLVSDFSSRLTFGFVNESSSVLQISLVSETPDRDIDFINKLCETFLAENLGRKNDAANKTIKFINEQLASVSDSLKVSESEMTNFRQKNKIVDATNLGSDLISKASKFDDEQASLKLKETYLNYLTKYLKTNLADGNIIAPASLGLNEPMLMALIQQINDLYLQRSNVTEKNMYYAKYSKEIGTIQSTIMEVIKNMRASLEIEKSDFQKRMDAVNNEITSLPNKELAMSSIDRGYKMNDNYYTFFLQKRAESEILKASNTPDNNILDHARIKSITNADKKSKTNLIYLLLGILIPALIVILIELLNNTIRTTKDIEKNSTFPLVGVVRHSKTDDPMVVAKHPRSAFTEMFRVIRTRIEFIVQRKTNITIMITSTESGDGKTYFSINLAAIYAMASKKTVLVDLDIRKPDLTKRFNIVQSNGVTNYLVNQCSIDEIILHLPKIDFDIITAGSIPPNPGELIRSDKLLDLFTELKKRYDFIIIDTSPVGIVTDAYAVVDISDINLFLARNNKTNKSLFKKLSAQLKMDNIPHLYTVINDVSDDGTKYSKYKLYKYSYVYGNNYGYTSSRKKSKDQKYFHYYEDETEI